MVVSLGQAVVFLQGSGEELRGAKRGLWGQGGSVGSCHFKKKNEVPNEGHAVRDISVPLRGGDRAPSQRSWLLRDNRHRVCLLWLHSWR